MAKKPRKTGASAAKDAEPEVTPASSTMPSTNLSRPSLWSLLVDVRLRRAVYIVLLAAMYSPLSQLTLAPVYGSIPSAIYHRYGVIASAMLAFGIRSYVPTQVQHFFASFTFWIPTIQFVLFTYSSVLGNPAGPLITECLTTYPLITLSIYFATYSLETLDLSFLGETIAEAAPSMLNYFLFIVFERTFTGFLPKWMGMNRLFTRVGLQMITAATYASVIPQSYIWPALPAIAFTAIGNPHAPLVKTTETLQNTLALHGYSLVERHESVTGYISVLQDNKNGFRVMRCDHSLLGGEWILPHDQTGKRRVAEPVYAVFTMLEAVRLVERPRAQGTEKALNIGLGVGTAPSALLAHGIDTTIIELDPLVHVFAVRHFNLPQNHTAWIGDAVAIVESIKDDHLSDYDYIIHDVFTGGAEPATLFTREFLSGLHDMLKPDGVVAINYAGDLAMPSTSLIYRTILDVFPSCRVFREDDQIGEEGTEIRDLGSEFTNMVFLCKKGTQTFKFRKPDEADYLGSNSRRSYMLPKHEVLPSQFQRAGELLTRANTKALEKMQVQSAIGHWKLMRRVIPAAIWENW